MDYEKFEEALGSWGSKLKPFIESKECDAIYEFLKFEGRRGKRICPESINTYRAFKETPYDQLKVVWLLQDPYHQYRNGVYTADGIAMSCLNTGKLQPSLELFYGGMEEDLAGGLDLGMLRDPDLTYLCNQGIMMLNTALTVEEGKTGTHKDIWKPFTKYLLEEVLSKYNNGLIFVLAGKESQYFARCINPLQHYIIEVEHPAYASRQNRPWRTQGVFKKINKILKENNNYEPTWYFEEAPF